MISHVCVSHISSITIKYLRNVSTVVNIKANTKSEIFHFIITGIEERRKWLSIIAYINVVIPTRYKRFRKLYL
jgi:hypothetical protein